MTASRHLRAEKKVLSVLPTQPGDSPTLHGVSTGMLPMTLARLASEFLALADLLADTDPSDPVAVRELESALDRSAADIKDKAVAVAAVIREFEARAAAAQAEVERLSAHARATTLRATWLRSYLLKNLQTLGIDRIETPTTLMAVRKSPPYVEILDEEQIPTGFRHVVESIDRSRLRTALLNGEAIAGARLTQGAHLWLR